MTHLQMTERQVDEWERLWGAYIATLKAMDTVRARYRQERTRKLRKGQALAMNRVQAASGRLDSFDRRNGYPEQYAFYIEPVNAGFVAVE